MARNGSGVYSLPGTYEAVSGETIEAQQHNDPLEDLEQDANTPRPIVAGGTGATTAQGAINALFSGGKTVDDDEFLIADPSDNTKRVRIDAGNVTAGQTRVITAPDADLDLTGLATQAEGDILYRGASAWQRLAKGTAGQFLRQNAALTAPEWAAIPLRGHIFGLTLSNNTTDATNDIDIAAGEAASDGNDPFLMVLASALTKRLDAAWAVGTGNGGLDTGSIADGTYHVWLIERSDTGVVDALFSTSATSPTMPTNYDRKRRIGSIIRASGAILPFRQSGDLFELVNKVTDREGTTALADTLFPITVPSGVRTRPILEIMATYNTNTNGRTFIGSGDSSAANLIVSQYGGAVAFTTVVPIAGSVLTNLSAQIRLAVVLDNGSMLGHTLKTLGWIDTRGRDA